MCFFSIFFYLFIRFKICEEAVQKFNGEIWKDSTSMKWHKKPSLFDDSSELYEGGRCSKFFIFHFQQFFFDNYEKVAAIICASVLRLLLLEVKQCQNLHIYRHLYKSTTLYRKELFQRALR